MVIEGLSLWSEVGHNRVGCWVKRWALLHLLPEEVGGSE